MMAFFQSPVLNECNTSGLEIQVSDLLVREDVKRRKEGEREKSKTKKDLLEWKLRIRSV